MFAKLSKLEHKLGHIEIEDLQHLDVDSSDSFYVEVLEVFLEKYSQSFKIATVFGKKRDILVLTLIRKLEMLTEGPLVNISEVKLQVLLKICDSLRVCLRDTITLHPNQVQYLCKSLLQLILHFHISRSCALSAVRCLVNLLNKHPERIALFVGAEVQGYGLLAKIMATDEAACARIGRRIRAEAEGKDDKADGRLSIDGKADRSDGKAEAEGRMEADSKADHKAEHKADDKSAKSDSKGDEDDEELDLSLIHYCVKVIYMVLCQSEDAHKQLRGHLAIITAAIYRLSRCICNNHHVPSANPSVPAGSPSGGPSGESGSSSSLTNFPYTESNALLYIDCCKLLYILDVFPALDGGIEHYVHPSSALVTFLVNEKTSSWDSVQDLEDISVRLQTLTAQLSDTKLGLFWNPLVGLKAIEVLETVLLIVLTIAPLYLKNLYRASDCNSNYYYIGKLAECEESSLQLLLLASDSELNNFFKSAAVTDGVILNLPCMKLRRKALANSLVRILNRCLINAKQLEPSERCAFLTPILIILSKLVSHDRDALTAVKDLIFCTAYESEHAAQAQAVKPPAAGIGAGGVLGMFRSSAPSSAPAPTAAVQPKVLTKSQSAYSTRQMSRDVDVNPYTDPNQRHIDPKDCPPNTLRGELVALMTSLDTQIKRIVAEFVFVLCANDVNEFVYRTGFGNSVALLQLKGLV